MGTCSQNFHKYKAIVTLVQFNIGKMSMAIEHKSAIKIIFIIRET